MHFAYLLLLLGVYFDKLVSNIYILQLTCGHLEFICGRVERTMSVIGILKYLAISTF